MQKPKHDFLELEQIRFADHSGCSLHHQEIVDGIARSVTKISIPWWCKRRNRLLMKASRRRAAMRKMKILSHTLVGCKVMALFYV
jgi:hypothetical protein